MITKDWESINEELYTEAGEKELVCVHSEKPYIDEMKAQNIRVYKYLVNKYPERTFRLSKWHSHDFGQYQEIEELLSYDDGEDEEGL